MSGFYSDMQNLTTDLLRVFNQGNVAYVAMVPGNGPEDDPGEPSEATTPINATVRGVEFKYERMGSTVMGDLQVTFAAGGISPEMTGFFDIDGQRYKVVEIHANPSAGTVVAYTCIVRR